MRIQGICVACCATPHGQKQTFPRIKAFFLDLYSLSSHCFFFKSWQKKRSRQKAQQWLLSISRISDMHKDTCGQKVTHLAIQPNVGGQALKCFRSTVFVLLLKSGWASQRTRAPCQPYGSTSNLKYPRSDSVVLIQHSLK